jgi:hypothetical protein
MLRLILAFVVALAAIASLWITVLLDRSRTQVLAANRKIHARLVATASVVDDYRREFGRLPSDDEFNKIVDRTPIPRGPFKVNSNGPYLLTGKDVGRNCGGTDQQVSHFERAAFVVGMFDEDVMDCYSNDPPTHAFALRDDDLPTRDVPIERLLGVLLLFFSALLFMSFWRNRKARAGT